jgi:hypothetical protein
LLKAAKRQNKHVIPYLVGDKFLPHELPAYYGWGDENEALVYLQEGGMAPWKETAGAIDWLREVLQPANRKKSDPPKAAGPSQLANARLAKLPQSEDVWQAGIGRLAAFVKEGGNLFRPWLLAVANETQDLILAHGVASTAFSSDQFWDALAKAMTAPLAGKPQRPRTIKVQPGEATEALLPHLEELGIVLETTEQLELVDEMIAALGERMGDESSPPGIMDVPGVTPEQGASFCAAAATFFQQTPWKKVGYESAIQVSCPKFPGGPWYAVLMGQSGMTMGLTLYDRLDALHKLWEGDMSDEENARVTVASTVIFGEEAEMPMADLQAIEQYGWPIARSDAYPWAFRKEPGMSVGPLAAWQFELLDGCLRAVPDFVAQRPQDDPTPFAATPTVASGPLPLTLAWVE